MKQSLLIIDCERGSFTTSFFFKYRIKLYIYNLGNTNLNNVGYYETRRADASS